MAYCCAWKAFSWFTEALDHLICTVLALWCCVDVSHVRLLTLLSEAIWPDLCDLVTGNLNHDARVDGLLEKGL